MRHHEDQQFGLEILRLPRIALITLVQSKTDRQTRLARISIINVSSREGGWFKDKEAMFHRVVIIIIIPKLVPEQRIKMINY